MDNHYNLNVLKFFLVLVILTFSSISAVSQSTIRIIDEETDLPLIGATILSDAGNFITDENGNFTVQLTDFPIELKVSYIGYQSKSIMIKTVVDVPQTIKMRNDIVLETMTVTASKYERRLSESTVSVDVMKPQIIANTNTVDIDNVLDKISGVQMIDGQANIRGGSGYSYGAGSRVMLLVDDMPALQIDAGFPNWGDIPVENIDQVEIVKGAASSLYGSAALNGIINIRTGTPSATPETKVAASYKTFDTPRDESKKWWGDTARYEYMVSVVHKQKFNNLDVVGSFFHLKEESYLQATYDNRYRGTLKLKYQLSDKTFLGLNTLLNKGNNGDYFLWQYSDHRALQPLPGTTATHDNFRFFIDPSLRMEDKYGNQHRILTRYHYIDNINSGNQSNQSQTYYGEYQFQRNLPVLDLLVTSGLVASHTNTDAELFGDTTFTTQTFAGYAQLEKKLWQKLNLSGGIRYEYNQQNTPEEFAGVVIPEGKISAGKWIARLGASYEYMPFSSIRASWGQGYRFPTITERFITTTFGLFKIKSNPDLVPESGWTAELGIKQGVRINKLKGFIDAAIFTSAYSDMMEFTFGFDGFNPTFTSQNVGNTKINGFEISFLGTYNVGELTINGFGGYTYINPQYTNFEGNDSLQYSLSGDVNVLKYRSQHNGKFDLQFDYKKFSLGVAYTRSSHIANIDAVLEGRGFEFAENPDIVGVKEFREANNDGFYRWDTRISYEYQGAKLSFIIGNLTNVEYAIRPATLEPQRSFTLRFDYGFEWSTQEK